MNTERIKAKALQNGLVSETELEKMTEAQIHKFIFAPGFSTAATVTSVSGDQANFDVVSEAPLVAKDAVGDAIDEQLTAQGVPSDGPTTCWAWIPALWGGSSETR